MFEFHISRYSRDRYSFDQTIFQFNGNAILGDFAAARRFAGKMNAGRDLVRFPEQAVRAGDINAMGLIDEILHAVAAEYRRELNPSYLNEALAALEAQVGETELERVLARFSELFPPVAVYRGESSLEAYLQSSTGGLTHREIALEELLMLSLANDNPAFGRFDELFNDRSLKTDTAYREVIAGLEKFDDGQPGFGSEGLPLLEILRRPAREHPNSLFAQLEYIVQRFPSVLDRFQLRLLRGLDLMREESKSGLTGPSPAYVLDFEALESEGEPERFSPDREWMPSLVLIAKNVYVWLDQLSRKYGRRIDRLDAIPEEELSELARAGFTGLWLIGLWERSPASKRIKHLTGNPEAEASAYSLFDYTIANALGGDPAHAVLRAKAWAHGIRLAADMVPNHTGIYSRWVLEQPDWFLHLNEPPYPVYSFTGPDLSEAPGVGIYIEDHYYSRTDAAVVFKRVDHRNGRVHYIYHGNDGTSMPWNDTAQLNYLNHAVREAVIGTILEVARRFPVIRFDAAMTLAKKHIQRLWFPEPGQGGAIPSRSEHSMSRREFEAALPVEFWREVVDRVAAELPDTLLLAEAFWLMEGYFVRTLGMHRVYNSAFMNMLRDERNAEYRLVIKNTIEFDPEILKRYVNFMNNPDEDTAIEQFGDGGKYFGVCILMATMPGLPMFGHGQVEGLKEKYGMEYRRAYYDESPNQALIARHEHEIFPLLHRREIFAGVEHFRLFDLMTESGDVDENVFAFSNRLGDERSIVLYNNVWGEARGTIQTSAASAEKDPDGQTRAVRSDLADALGLPSDPNSYVIFRDQISGHEFIRSCADLHANGMMVSLGAYEARVFLDFRIVHDNEAGHYRLLEDVLGGRGIINLESSKQEIVLQPLLDPWRAIVQEAFFRKLIAGAVESDPAPEEEPSVVLETALQEAEEKLDALMRAVVDTIGLEPRSDPETLAGQAAAALSTAIAGFRASGEAAELDWAVLLSWRFAAALGLPADDASAVTTSRAWLDEWLFGRAISLTLAAFGGGHREIALVPLLVSRAPGDWILEDAALTLQSWLQDGETALFLGVNRYQGVVWLDAEALAVLTRWTAVLAEVDGAESGLIRGVTAEILEAGQAAGYRVDDMLQRLSKTGPDSTS